MAGIIYPILTVAHIALFAWGFMLWRRKHHLSAVLLMVVGCALIYDNLIISIGNTVGEGNLLQILNHGRFGFHTFFTPLMIVAAYEIVRRAEIAWAQSNLSRIVVWVCCVLLIAVGYLTSYAGLDLISTDAMPGVLRYVEAESSGPPLAPILTIVIVIGLGVVLFRSQRKWMWLMVGSILMFVGAAMQPFSSLGPAIGSIAEVVFMVTFWLTESNLQRSAARQEQIWRTA